MARNEFERSEITGTMRCLTGYVLSRYFLLALPSRSLPNYHITSGGLCAFSVAMIVWKKLAVICNILGIVMKIKHWPQSPGPWASCGLHGSSCHPSSSSSSSRLSCSGPFCDCTAALSRFLAWNKTKHH